jgi:hypothetical protein
MHLSEWLRAGGSSAKSALSFGNSRMKKMPALCRNSKSERELRKRLRSRQNGAKLRRSPKSMI